MRRGVGVSNGENNLDVKVEGSVEERFGDGACGDQFIWVVPPLKLLVDWLEVGTDDGIFDTDNIHKLVRLIARWIVGNRRDN
jgi:hypothetical protein